MFYSPKHILIKILTSSSLNLRAILWGFGAVEGLEQTIVNITYIHLSFNKQNEVTQSFNTSIYGSHDSLSKSEQSFLTGVTLLDAVPWNGYVAVSR